MSLMPTDTGINPSVVRALMGNRAPTVGTPTDAFVWGAGGAQLTPDEIAADRALALDRTRSDYSPVQHWTQGLARVADQWLGALELRDLDKQRETAREESNARIAAALGAGNEDIAALLTSGDKVAASLADNLYAVRNPKPQQPTEFERALVASGVQPGTPEWIAAMRAKVQNTTDPIISGSIGGRDFFGPRSLVMPDLTAQSGPPMAPPEAIAELRANPGTAAQFDEVFGQGASARILGGL